MTEIDLKTDEKMEESPKVQRKSLKSYTSMVLQESSLTAVSHIAVSQSTCRRLFKIFVLLTCFAGFFYQSYTFLCHIFQYPTIVDIRIENPKLIEMPGLTFCNNNGINRKKFCVKFPERCFEADENFCFKYPSYCEANQTTMVPHKEYYSLVNNLTATDLLELGHDIDELVRQSGFEDVDPEGPFIRAKTIFGMGRMGCYSLFSIVDSPKKPRTTKIKNMVGSPAMILIFNLREDTEFIPGHKTGMFFSVHSPYEGNNPTRKGIFLQPGKTYKVYVNTDVEAFSYIGGFIGVWLGISLVEVADFVESMFRILRYALKKKEE
ncbi:uncharacterized protein CDAR_575131 [Caerostris darwini]|uniref:Uncharacterized protein n=1 Tax=Caerostris darwini TaxID=1538125 RepID=A0AAV4MW04_9ARAC|nr:uncharacterized protein CDAR_575131 [Caerostris darwini]